MLWFEKPFLAVLHREYGRAMRFTEDEAADVMPSPPSQPCQLYVHVPFCEVLCPFCSFHRVRYNEAKTHRYFEALRREIRIYHDAGFRFGDVYFGGGTPTVDARELIATLELIRSLSSVHTVSVETNPNHLDREALTAYRDAGVTRLSVGVQSFDDGLLRGMDRLEKYGDGRLVEERIASVMGLFPTLNVDMIFNLPGQTLEMLDHDLDVIERLHADQVSFYPLMTAPTARHKMEKTMGSADQTLRHPMYERILERLRGHGEYHAASAWCFSRNQGMFDEYIIDQNDYVGVGSGAFSYVGGAYYSTTFSLNHYCRRVEHGQTGITQKRAVGRWQQMRYDYLVRLFGGELRRDYIERRYGREFWWRMAPELTAMRLIGATRHDADAIRLTERGMYCWMLMMAEFFNSVNNVREQMREHIRAELDAWNEEAKVPVAAIGGRASRESAT